MRCDDLDVDRIGGYLVIDEEAEVLPGGEFSGGLDGQTARRVDGDRLGDVDVAAGGHGGRGLLGIEAGDIQHAQRLDAAVQHLLIARQAREAARLVHAEGLAAGMDEVREVVGHGEELVPAVVPKQLFDAGCRAARSNCARLRRPR